MNADNNNNMVELKPTKEEKTKLEIFEENIKNSGFDIYMILELIVFVISFFVLVGEGGETKFRLSDSAFLYHFNSLLLIDFLFRMLSLKIESMKREYWNHTLHCVFPLAIWLLAAFYKFDDVFGSEPIQVWNSMLFTILNVLIILAIIFKFISINEIKERLQKRKERRESKEENDIEK